MVRILVYTFFNHWHITHKIVRSIQINSVDVYFLGNLASLEKHMVNIQPEYVLGLGDFRKDSKTIRVEKIFTNKQGNRPIIINGKNIYPATWELSQQEGVIYTEKTFGGPCNRSSYILSKSIEDHHLQTKFAFVHIPSHYPEALAKNTVNTWLKSIKT